MSTDWSVLIDEGKHMMQDKRLAILDALEQMVQDRRFDEVTLDRIAEVAHVSKGTIYTYFRDKEDLFFQFATHGHDELCDMVRQQASAQDGGSFEERLVAICTRLSQFFTSRHALFRVMGEHESRLGALQGGRRKTFEEHRARLRAALADVLAMGVPTGHVRTGIPLETQAVFLLGLTRIRDLAFRDAEEQPSIATVIDVFLHGVQGGSIGGGHGQSSTQVAVGTHT